MMENSYFNCEDSLNALGMGDANSICSQVDPQNIAKMLQLPPDFYPMIMPTITIMSAVMKEILSRQCMSSSLKKSKSVEKEVPISLAPEVETSPETVIPLPCEQVVSKPEETCIESVVPKPSEPEACQTGPPKPPPMPVEFMQQLQSKLKSGRVLIKKSEGSPTGSEQELPTTPIDSQVPIDKNTDGKCSVPSLADILANKSNLKKRSPDSRPVKPVASETPNPIIFSLKPVSRRQSVNVDNVKDEGILPSSPTLKSSSPKTQADDLQNIPHSSDGPKMGNGLKRRVSINFDKCIEESSENIDPKLRERLNRQKAKAEGIIDENAIDSTTEVRDPSIDSSLLTGSPDDNNCFRNKLKRSVSVPNKIKPESVENIDPKLRERLNRQKEKAEGIHLPKDEFPQPIPKMPEMVKEKPNKPMISSKPSTAPKFDNAKIIKDCDPINQTDASPSESSKIKVLQKPQICVKPAKTILKLESETNGTLAKSDEIAKSPVSSPELSSNVPEEIVKPEVLEQIKTETSIPSICNEAVSLIETSINVSGTFVPPPPPLPVTITNSNLTESKVIKTEPPKFIQQKPTNFLQELTSGNIKLRAVSKSGFEQRPKAGQNLSDLKSVLQKRMESHCDSESSDDENEDNKDISDDEWD